MPINTLFVFTKPNRIGLSKTRLARDIGLATAQRINAMSTARVVRQIDDPRWQTALMVAPDISVSLKTPQWPSHIVRLPQGPGNLGDRMQAAFDLAPMGKVTFVGTDMPDLTRQLIARAFQSLSVQDAVFGPADDGGFWLYAQKKRTSSRAPFSNVRWSTKFALADVRRNIGSDRIGYLPEFVDLDDFHALKKWQQKR